MTRHLSALVIATGSGAPMRSERPKPLHVLCGRPMLRFMLDALEQAGATKAAIVTGSGAGGRVSKRILEDPPGIPLTWVEQRFDRGSADAAHLGVAAFEDFDDDGDVLIVPADLPLLRPQSLRDLVQSHRESGAACTVLGAEASSDGDTAPQHGTAPQHRIVRNRHDAVTAIRRSEDLIGDEVTSREIALGVYCVRRGLLSPAARRIRPDVVDGTQRLLDIVEVLTDTGHSVSVATTVDDLQDVRPVDDRIMLAEAERELRRRTNRAWLERGVTMIDPERTYLDVTVRLGTDVTLFPGTILQGATTIAEGCEIGPDTRLDRVEVGPNTVIEKSVAVLATIGQECRVGPFASIEAGSEILDGTVTGPFYAAGAGD